MNWKRWFSLQDRETSWEERFNTLATYNTEVARGLVHTPEWKKKMARLQVEYNWRYQHSSREEK